MQLMVYSFGVLMNLECNEQESYGVRFEAACWCDETRAVKGVKRLVLPRPVVFLRGGG